MKLHGVTLVLYVSIRSIHFIFEAFLDIITAICRHSLFITFMKLCITFQTNFLTCITPQWQRHVFLNLIAAFQIQKDTVLIATVINLIKIYFNQIDNYVQMTERVFLYCKCYYKEKACFLSIT